MAKEIDAARPEDSQLPTAQIDALETAIDVCLELPDSDKVDNFVQKLKVTTELYLRKTLDEVSAASVRWKAGRALVAASRICLLWSEGVGIFADCDRIPPRD